jgi:ribosomal protein S19E (S16A)
MTVLPYSRAVPLDRYGFDSVAARIARRTQNRYSASELRTSTKNIMNDAFSIKKISQRAKKPPSNEWWWFFRHRKISLQRLSIATKAKFSGPV